ncbi:MAG TPA: GNAT family N-acetyltransferase [Gemmatimonadaceae bacterium]|nr:GNAT family N-acetyltransferase [Gemmatimonadaceae bacterium]
MESAQLPVIDNQAERRFELHADGAMSILTYRITGDRIRLIHTEVPPDQRGRGYADLLARAALERAARDHLRVVPLCPFVRAFLERHPEYNTLVVPDRPQ